MGTRRWLVAAAVVGLILSACRAADTSEQTTTTGSSTTVVPDTTTSTSPVTPGEVVDFGPRAGDVLMVVGVRFDDVLDLRSLPGPDQPIVATLAPDDMSLVALGETRQTSNALWVAVAAGRVEGWVELRHVGYEGLTDDLTASVVEDLGGYPTASTMTELGLFAAQSLASEEPESGIVVVKEEAMGDLGEVTYDIIGLGDDAVLGLRAHVFGEPVSDGFSLKSVEVTAICGRGLGPDGLCR